MKFLVIFIVATFVGVSHNSTVPVKAGEYTSFSYDVADPLTGDYKSQVESRIDGFVKGHYSLIDADGRKRIVEYSADDKNGFQVNVRKEPRGTIFVARSF
ncbi:unnamed protein product, partial [Brenthis ino]